MKDWSNVVRKSDVCITIANSSLILFHLFSEYGVIQQRAILSIIPRRESGKKCYSWKFLKKKDECTVDRDI